MLKLTDVTWLYQHLPMRFTLSVRQGEIIAVLGPSGAGKSTLLNLVAGFLQPASGSIIIENRDHTHTPPAKRPVSMLFQENNLFTHLTVRQNIALGMHPGLRLNDAQRQMLEIIAAQMGINEFIDRLPGELSMSVTRGRPAMTDSTSANACPVSSGNSIWRRWRLDRLSWSSRPAVSLTRCRWLAVLNAAIP